MQVGPFYEPVIKLESTSGVLAAVILGDAMAHELGHLLLGTNSHSESGLMRARWDQGNLAKAQKGTLSFSPVQALEIRRRLGKAKEETSAGN